MPFIPSAGGGSGTAITSATITQTAHGFAVNQAVYLSGANTWAKARADADATSDVVGIVSTVVDVNNFKITQQGLLTGLTGLTAGSALFLSDVTAGLLTHTAPTATSSYRKPLAIAESATTAWVNIEIGTPTNGNVAVVQSQAVVLNADQALANTANAFTDVPGGQFTINIPSAGTWWLGYSVMTSFAAGTQNSFIITDASNTYVSGTNVQMVSGATLTNGMSRQTRVVTTGPTTYKVRYSTNGTGNLLGQDVGTGAAGSTIWYNQIGASPVPMSFAGEYGENNGITAGQTTSSATFTDITGSAFTLPSAGIWAVNYTLSVADSIVNGQSIYRIADAAGNAIANTQSIYTASTSAARGTVPTNTVYLTTTGPATYKLQAAQNNGGTLTVFNATGINTGASKVTWQKISGFVPTTGSTVDYLYARPTAFTPTASSDIPLVTLAGNITNASGAITLLAGKTYALEAAFDVTNGGGAINSFFEFGFVDSANVALPFSSLGETTPVNGTNTHGSLPATATITPLVNMTVKVRTTVNVSTSLTANLTGCYVRVTQLGSTATTTRTLSSVMVTNLTSPSIPNTGTPTAVTTGWVVSHDPTNAFNTTTGLFTCPRAGRYQVNFSYTYNSSAWAVANLWRAHILKNGTPVAQTVAGAQAAFTTILGQSVSHVIDCAAGDTISVAASNTRATGATIFTANALENVWSIAELPSAV